VHDSLGHHTCIAAGDAWLVEIHSKPVHDHWDTMDDGTYIAGGEAWLVEIHTKPVHDHCITMHDGSYIAGVEAWLVEIHSKKANPCTIIASPYNERCSENKISFQRGFNPAIYNPDVFYDSIVILGL
jgi:hypothetical protein